MKKTKCLSILIMVLLGFIIMSGCEKNDPETTNLVKDGSVDADIARAVIGRGYDISGRFAYSEDIEEAVLDFSKLAGESQIIKDGNIASTEVDVAEGETVKEYQASFSYARTGSAGVEGLFSAETGVNFGYERAQMSGYSYATVSSFTYKYGMYVDGRKNPSSLTDFVSAQFLKDAESLSVEELIEIYGTHVIVGAKWGASFDYSMSAKRKSVSNEYSFGAFAKAEATIEGISLGGSQEIHTKFSDYYESSSKSIYTKAKGGNSEYALAIASASSGEARDNAYSSWIETIDQNPAFCDYYEGGLVPVYEFIADEDLKTKVESGVLAYMEENEIESLEPVEKTISSDFHVANFCIADPSAGDSEIDADGGGDIYVEVTLTIAQQLSSNNLELKIDMKVHEMKGDYSKLEGQTTATIVNNDPINSIELTNTTYTFSLQGKFDPDNGEYFSVFAYLTLAGNLPPAWIDQNALAICIDGKGGDEDVIGIKGKVDIPVTVYDF